MNDNARASRGDDLSAVLALNERLRDALHERDVEVVEELYADGFMLNGPAGRLQTRQETIDLLRRMTGRQSEYERTIETAYTSGDVVVIMGRESLVWEHTGTDLDGKRTARRFTNVWQRIDGSWRQIARQATTVPADD